MVCYYNKELCKAKSCKRKGDEPSDDMTPAEVIEELKKYRDEKKNLNGLLDHIYGYKKIRDYTL